MNLEEAVNKLNEIVLKCLQYTAELGYETDIYNGDTPIPYKEIERVLQELENSISKDKVKEIKGKIQLEYEKNIEKNPTYAFVLKCKLEILEELLEDK